MDTKSNATIVYIGGFELPDKNAAAHRVLNNAKIMREEEKNVVFIGIDKQLSADSNVLDTITEWQGFTAFSIPYPQNSKQWVDYLAGINRYIQVLSLYDEISAVIFYDFQAIAMRKFMKYCKRRDIKCYADITEWYSSKGQGMIRGILKKGDTFYRMRILHKRMDGLIVISRYLEEYYHNCKNVVRIPTLTDKNEEKWDNPYIKSKRILKLVYAGSPAQKDRIDILIEALRYTKREIQLDVIGLSLENYLERVPQDNDFLKEHKNIVFHGRLPHTETLEYVKKANYSCFFRNNDRVSKAGFPTKFAEAITCGTPVITNKTSNIAEYINDGENGVLVNILSAQEIAQEIDQLELEREVDRETFDYRKYIGFMCFS